MTRYGVALDTVRCVACNACAVACKVENNLSEGMWWNRAHTDGGDYDWTPGGEYPNGLYMDCYTLSCQHCDNPSCVEVCPTGASQKREDGIVWIDQESCIGCKSCITACPYPGVRTYIDGEPEYILDFAVGDATLPAHKGNVVEKCTMCYQKVDRGEKPTCMGVCRFQARIWGDLDDPDSDISKALASREYTQLETEVDTGSNFYLLK